MRLRMLKRMLADALEQRANLPRDWRKSINYEVARLRRMIKDMEAGGSRRAARNAVARTTASGGRSRSVGADAAARRASVKMRWTKSRLEAKKKTIYGGHVIGNPDVAPFQDAADKAIDAMADRLVGQAMNGARVLDKLELVRQQTRHYEYRPGNFSWYQPSGLRPTGDARAMAGRDTMRFDNRIRDIKREARDRIKEKALAGTLKGDSLLEERKTLLSAFEKEYRVQRAYIGRKIDKIRVVGGINGLKDIHAQGSVVDARYVAEWKKEGLL